MEPDPDRAERRRLQLRDAQRRRREKLSAGTRHQINLFLSPDAIRQLDTLCQDLGLERHQIVDRLIELAGHDPALIAQITSS